MNTDREGVVVVGAGPYGLSVAAHLHAARVPVHVLGETMGYWREHMPAGMCLKSSWRASTIASPEDRLSLSRYEAARGAPLPRPIPVEEFIRYGSWYQQTAVPEIDSRRAQRIERERGGFRLQLDDGEELHAATVVLATGLQGMQRIPAPFDGLPATHVSHSADLPPLETLRGKRVCVIGAGQSALETAVLAREAGAEVRVLVREPEVHWLTRKARLDRGRGHWLYAPSDVGPAGVSWLVSLPALMQILPDRGRAAITRRCLRPAVTEWVHARADAVTVTGGARVSAVALSDSGVRLTLGSGDVVLADHVVLGTGFRLRLEALGLLAPELRAAVRTADGLPELSEGYETSVPGLHIVGALATGSFGPLPRFVAGTWSVAPAVAAHLAGSAHRRPAAAQPRRPLAASTPPT